MFEFCYFLKLFLVGNWKRGRLGESKGDLNLSTQPTITNQKVIKEQNANIFKLLEK